MGDRAAGGQTLGRQHSVSRISIGAGGGGLHQHSTADASNQTQVQRQLLLDDGGHG